MRSILVELGLLNVTFFRMTSINVIDKLALLVGVRDDSSSEILLCLEHILSYLT